MTHVQPTRLPHLIAFEEWCHKVDTPLLMTVRPCILTNKFDNIRINF